MAFQQKKQGEVLVHMFDYTEQKYTKVVWALEIQRCHRLSSEAEMIKLHHKDVKVMNPQSPRFLSQHVLVIKTCSL